ncbi:MAG: flavodoxin [Acidobacteriota bacterium]
MHDSTHRSDQSALSMVIAWGSSTGYTEDAAKILHGQLRHVVDTIVDIGDTDIASLENYDVLILGVPTWHIGELQDDWDICFDELADLDLSGKAVAIFGCGDADGYPETYQDAMGILWEQLEATGATLIGRWPIDGYDFQASRALTEDGRHFVGLALDEHCQDHLTEERIERWAQQIQSELARLAEHRLAAVAS